MRYKIYGQKVRELRETKGVSQRAFAKMVDLSYMSLRRVEDEKTNDENGLSEFTVDVKKIKDIAKSLGTTFENLISDQITSQMYCHIKTEKSLAQEVREYVKKEYGIDIQDEQIIPFLFFIIRSKK